MEARNISHVTWDKDIGFLKVNMERDFGTTWEDLILEFIQVWSPRILMQKHKIVMPFF